MSYKQNIEIEYISRGNNSATKDSVYEAIIKTSGEWPVWTDDREFHPSAPYIEELSKFLLRDWKFKAEDERSWGDTYLKTCEELEPGTWRVVIIEPATD